MDHINRYIDHTVLKPDITSREIEKVVSEGITYKFAGICVPPCWVKKVRKDLDPYDIELVTVAGFPLGYQKTEVKLEEIRQGIGDGATEIDVVWNISAFKEGKNWVKTELENCATLVHQFDCLLKVIIETAYLNDKEIEQACMICKDAGVDFVKTSTGFAPEGAKTEHIRLMRSVLPSNVGVKAAGGIKDLAFAQELIQAGADRLGTSSGVKIVEEAIGNQDQK